MQWQALEIFWIGISDNIEATKEAWRNSDGDVTAKSPWELKGGHGEGNSRVDMDHGNSRVASNHESLNHEVGNTSLRVHLPSAKDTHVSEGQLKEEKGIPGRGEVESLSTNSQPPAKPTPTVYELVDMQAEKREAAAAAVDADLLALPVYVALLGWPELESHLGEAAAAELNARGSGAKLILARFAERTGS